MGFWRGRKTIKKLLMTMVVAPGRPPGPRVVIDHKGLVGVPRWKMTRWRQILGWKGPIVYVWFMPTLIPWWYWNMENACPISQMWRPITCPLSPPERPEITRLLLTDSSHTTYTWVDATASTNWRYFTQLWLRLLGEFLNRIFPQ